MSNDVEPAVRWLNQRLATSDLIQHYFSLRDEGLDPRAGAEAVGTLADVYVLGRCAYLATIAARKVGRDRFVAFHWPDGRLIHAVVACVPQHAGEPLRGDCLDVLGRSPLAGMEQALSACVAPVTVAIGELAEDVDFLDGEQAAISAICAQLPWLRRGLLLPEPHGAGPADFMAATAWTEHVRGLTNAPHAGADGESGAARPPS